MTNGFERKQEQRYAVLRYMYDVAVEDRNVPTMSFHEDEVVRRLSYPKQDVKSALDYLEGERLAEIVSKYLNGARSYRLTHQGIKEIERSFQKPEEPTEHFPAQVNMHFTAPVGAIQTGTHATANVTQNISVDLPDVFSLLEQLKPQVTELPPEQQEDALVSIEVLEDELKSQDKNPKRIRGLLVGLGGIAQGTVTFASQVAILAQQLKNLGVF